MMEEVIDDQLVNIVSQELVLSVFIDSETGELVNSVKNSIVIIYNLNSIEPTSLRGSLVQ